MTAPDEAAELRRLLRAERERREALERQLRRYSEALERISGGVEDAALVATEALDATPLLDPKPEGL